MIESHLSEASLNDYAEGRVTGAELASAEQHLAECVRCRSAANRLCAVLEQLRALPRELDPGADLLPAIRAETQRRRVAQFRHRAVQSRRPGLRELRWPRAAAAAALIVAGASLTVLAVRSTGDGGAPDRASDPVTATGGVRPDRLGDDPPDGEAPLDELRLLEAEYARATGELLAVFREEGDGLSAGTVRLIEDNIQTVERALRQSQQALNTDPDSPVLRELVLAAHRQRLDMLRRAAVLAVGGP